MDLADIKAQARKAREFTHPIGDKAFTILTPTKTELRACVFEHKLFADGAGQALAGQLLMHHLLRSALIGWTGVRESDVLPGAGSAPLPWSADAADAYLDANPDDADALGAAMLAKTRLRNDAIEEDAKN